MTSIKIEIPVGLTAAYIERANSNLKPSEARELAAELHAIIADYRNLYSVRPPGEEGHASQETDAMLAMWSMALGMWEQTNGAKADQEDPGVWVMLAFDDIGGDELYQRWLKVGDRILGSNLADPFKDDDEPEPAL
jgi:hypothetical protein